MTLMFMLVIFFGLIGCNEGSTLEDLDFDEQIDAPVNLVVTGEVLTWDAVTNANGYYVYIGGEKVDTVRTNSFNFSNEDGDRHIFTVVTKAPRGMQDSVHSVAIAYIRNKTQEITSMKAAVAASPLALGDDFAIELVNRGMLTSEFNAMMDAFENVGDTEIPDASNIEDYYNIIDTLMESVQQPEAFVSALVIHVLPAQIDDQISQIDQEILDYQSIIDDPYTWDHEYYEQLILDLRDEKLALEEVINLINSSPDHVISTIMTVVDYFMEFEALVSDNLITYINNLTEVEDIANINVAEVVAIKEEIVMIMRETMPAQKDVVLAIQTMYSMNDYIEVMYDSKLGNLYYPEKMAASMMMSMEAYINFIDFLDEEFFQDLKTIGTSDVSEYQMSAQAAILGITYFDGFKEEYQGLFDEMRELYTDEEKNIVYDDTIESLDDMLSADSYMPSIDFPTFDKMMKLDAIFQDAFDELLDAIVESDGKLFLIIADRLEYENEYYENDIEWDVYNFNSKVYNFKLLDQVVYLINSVVSERSEAEFVEVRDFLVDTILEVTLTNFNFESAEQQDIRNAVDSFMTETKGAQHDLVVSISKYLDTNDTFLNYANLYETTYRSNMTKLNEEENYFDFIFFMGVFDEYMTLGNRADVDKVVVELSVIFGVHAIIDLQDLTDKPDAIDEVLDYIDSVANEISNMNPATLTTSQKTRIDDVLEEITDILDIPTK